MNDTTGVPEDLDEIAEGAEEREAEVNDLRVRAADLGDSYDGSHAADEAEGRVDGGDV